MKEYFGNNFMAYINYSSKEKLEILKRYIAIEEKRKI